MTPARWILTLLSFGAAIGISLWVVASSWSESGSAALPMQVHLTLVLLTAAEVLARVVKLQLSAASLRIALPFGTASRVILGGDFAAGITPSRSGSEPARFLILSESGMAAAHTVLLLFMELFLEMLSLAIVGVALAIVFSGAGAALGGLVGVIGGYAAFVLFVGGAGALLAQRGARGPPPRWAAAVGLNASRWRAVQRGLHRLRTSLVLVRDARRGVATLALAASVAHIALRLAILPVLVRSLDATVELAPLVVWPLALSYGAVVAPVPGGGGFVEVTFRAALDGVIPPALLARSLIWWRFYTFYALILVGALAAGRTVLRALRGDARAEPADANAPRGRRRRGHRRGRGGRGAEPAIEPAIEPAQARDAPGGPPTER